MKSKNKLYSTESFQIALNETSIVFTDIVFSMSPEVCCLKWDRCLMDDLLKTGTLILTILLHCHILWRRPRTSAQT